LTLLFLFARIWGLLWVDERLAMALTKRQRQMYDFIAEFVESNGYSPSFEEIGAAMGLSSLATVHKHINNLETKQFLRRDYNRSRSIDVLPLPEGIPARARAITASSFELPLVGRIAAGKPIEQVETPETISLTDFTRGKDVFVLQVMGESMQDEHIVNGDYVLVEKTASAHDGEIVVALVNGSETTLKRLYHAGEQIRLQPSNASMQPIMLPAAAVQVQGRVVAVLRKY
jgi:repressor LexA